MPGGKPVNTLETFWSRVDRNGPVPSHIPELGACWTWTSFTNADGYGMFKMGGKKFASHRLSWTLANGREPDDQILHKCDNPACVRPDHLFPGSQVDNIMDCKAKGRIARRPGSLAPVAKLSDDAVLEIRSSAMTIPDLAAKFGVTVECVRHAKKRLTWSHLP